MSVMSIVRSVSFILSAAVAAIVAGLQGGCTSYSPGWYSGDGAMYATPKGKGLSAATAYDIEFPQVNLLVPGRHVFKLDNLPNEQLLTMVSLDEPSQEKLEWIDKGRIRVALTIIENESGRTSVKQGHLLEDWNVTPESWAGQPLEFEGAWFKPRRHDTFTLVVDVFVDQSLEGQSAPPTTVTATPHVRGASTGLGKTH